METHFDVLVLGTGLTQSITAAALSKAGFKVLHIDQNPYYGGDQASLSHDELLHWSKSPPPLVSAVSASSSSPLPFSRSYSLSLAPGLIPSAGPLITCLILSGVSRYGRFKLLDSVYIYSRNSLHRVPGNKEDVFKARDVSLIDKRKIMRFLQFAAGAFEDAPELQGQAAVPLFDFIRDKFSLGEETVEAILYALSYCHSPEDLALPALVRLRRYLRSAGRYGSSPFLVGHYGGLGELAQGFCRTCAVNGGTYILGRKILGLHLPFGSRASPSEAGRASVQLEDVPDVLTADYVIATSDYLSPPNNVDTGPAYACCVAIIDRPVFSILTAGEPHAGASENASDRSQSDTAVIVFPPGSLQGGNAPNAVQVLQMGEATLSCPGGKYVLYLCTRTDDVPETILRPYLSAITAQNENDSSVEFFLFYTRREGKGLLSQQPRTLVVPPLCTDWPEIADQAAQEAESLFWDVVKVLAPAENEVEAFWPVPEQEEDEEDAGEDW